MPKTFNQLLMQGRAKLDKVTDRAARAMAADLMKIRADAVKRIQALAKKVADDDGKLKTKRAKSAAQATLADIKDAFAKGLSDASDVLREARVNGYKAAWLNAQRELTVAGQDAELRTGVSLNQAFIQAAKKAQTMRVGGVEPDEAFAGTQTWLQKNLQDSFAQSTMRGEPITRVAQRVEEITGVATRAATRIARTHVAVLQNAAHDDVYRENADIIDGRTWDATFDSDVCPVCVSLHGRYYSFDETPPSPEWGAGVAHPNCRCQLLPHFSDEDVQQALDEDTERRAKAEDGYEKIGADVSMDEWLSDRPESFQREVFGTDIKTSLFRDGYLSSDDMVWPDLTTRTDAEAVELALARSPADKELQALADEVGAGDEGLGAIRAQEKRIARRAPFDQGVKQ